MNTLNPSISKPPTPLPQPDAAQAAPEDAPRIAALLEECAPDTIPVPEDDVARRIENFRVIREAGQPRAAAAIAPISDDHAELRSVAVAKEAGGRGLGTRIVKAVQDEARRRNRRLFCVTTSPSFFSRLGFEVVPMKMVPEKPERQDYPCTGTRVAMTWNPADTARERNHNVVRDLAKSA